MKIIKKIAFVLVIIGGLNWGIYGLIGYDLVDVFIGSIPMIARILYVLIGLSALYLIINKYTVCRCCLGNCSTCAQCTCTQNAIEKVTVEEIK